MASKFNILDYVLVSKLRKVPAEKWDDAWNSCCVPIIEVEEQHKEEARSYHSYHSLTASWQLGFLA